MKFSSFVLSVICPLIFAGSAFAQTVDTGKVDASQEGTTTIKVEKTKNGQTPPSQVKTKWEIHDGSADVEGEAAATAKEAKAAWKKACEDWKKETREDNKENKVLSLNCGVSSCGGEAGSKVCTSKATFKIKTKIEE